MTEKGFYSEPTPQSVVKMEIVRKYFWAWAKIIISTQNKYPRRSSGQIAYVDFFCGPGRYQDGSKSTPLLVLEGTSGEKDIQDRLIMIFNDVDSELIQKMCLELENSPEAALLAHPPRVYNEEVGPDFLRHLDDLDNTPKLSFIDPWGYKGLSLDLIGSVISDWGSDCILFFNYNRINLGLENILVKQHMDALFGEPRANELRQKLTGIKSGERELFVIEEICRAFKEIGGTYVLPFRFRDKRGTRTTHHLIFVTKSSVGYGIMKDIMSGESSRTEQGVGVFEYNPVDTRYPLLMELTPRLDELKELLLKDFRGRRLTREQIYNRHQTGTLYTDRDYREALIQLETEGRIQTFPPAEKRTKRKGQVTFAKHVEVQFPIGDES